MEERKKDVVEFYKSESENEEDSEDQEWKPSMEPLRGESDVDSGDDCPGDEEARRREEGILEDEDDQKDATQVGDSGCDANSNVATDLVEGGCANDAGGAEAVADPEGDGSPTAANSRHSDNDRPTDNAANSCLQLQDDDSLDAFVRSQVTSGVCDDTTAQNRKEKETLDDIMEDDGPNEGTNDIDSEEEMDTDNCEGKRQELHQQASIDLLSDTQLYYGRSVDRDTLTEEDQDDMLPDLDDDQSINRNTERNRKQQDTERHHTQELEGEEMAQLVLMDDEDDTQDEDAPNSSTAAVILPPRLSLLASRLGGVPRVSWDTLALGVRRGILC